MNSSPRLIRIVLGGQTNSMSLGPEAQGIVSLTGDSPPEMKVDEMSAKVESGEVSVVADATLGKLFVVVQMSLLAQQLCCHCCEVVALIVVVVVVIVIVIVIVVIVFVVFIVVVAVNVVHRRKNLRVVKAVVKH